MMPHSIWGICMAVRGKRLRTSAPFQLTCYDRQVPRPEWYRNAVFYQIFPDRFANGNPHGEIDGKKPNTFLYGTTADRPMYIYDENHRIARWDFYGGNLRGIIAKLPYLKRLGVTALYLNPIFEASSNQPPAIIATIPMIT